MEEKLIQRAAKNFLLKHDINSSVLTENCVNFLKDSVKQLQKEDWFFFEDIYTSLTSKQQTELLEMRLEMQCYNLPEIFNKYSSLMEQVIKETIELNIDNEMITEENSNIILEDIQTIFELHLNQLILAENGILDESFLDKIKTEFGASIKNIMMQIVKYITTKLLPPSLAGGVSYALIKFSPLAAAWYVPLIYFAVILTIYAISRKVIGHITNTNMSKEQIELFKDFMYVFKVLGNVLQYPYEKFKYRFMVIYKNDERCYKKAGISYKDLNNWMLIGAKLKNKNESVVQDYVLRKSNSKFLLACFLESYLDRISIFLEMYYDCLKKSGNWTKVSDLPDDKFLSMMRMRGGLFPICNEYRENAIKAIETYEKIVEYFYEEDPSEKSKWLLLMDRYVLDTKNAMQKDVSQYKDDRYKSGFGTNNPKLKKYTKDLK